MKWCMLLLSALVLSCGAVTNVSADEWEDYTPYYEDDAWYDVSEWFDGNDYNPTDEEFLEWDDEVYQYDPDSPDVDNDNWYGYTDIDTTDDWFYDYYDYGYDAYQDYDYDEDLYDDEVFESGFRYYDFDNDGINDAYVSYYDWDGDGWYEDYNYYWFSDVGTKEQKQRARQQAPKRSKQQQMTGTIERAKQVKVRGNTHLVVGMKQDDQQMTVDLGSARSLNDLNLKLGQEITVRGMMTRVGDKSIVLAQVLNADGRTRQLDRQRREIQGKVVDTRKNTIRGAEHMIAIVNTEKGKLAVDLGPARKLDVDVQKGDELTFTGVPVKVKDRRFMMAQTVKHDGQTTRIDRTKKTRKSAKTNS